MTTEVKRLIRVRVEKGATFKRDGFGKKRQLSDSWRKPRGQHNKQREQKKAKGALPKPGFGSPIAVRGMHPSGFFEVMVFSEKDLEGLNPKTQAVRIGGTVGERKRMALQEKAGLAGLKVLNTHVVKSSITAKKSPAPEKDADKSSFYFETSDGVTAGFMEPGCFSELLICDIYRIAGTLGHDDPTREPCSMVPDMT